MAVDPARAVPVLTASTTVEAPPEAAFDLFTAGFGRWWPPEFSWSGAQGLTAMGMEPGIDGFLYERGPHGLRLDWGRVLEWDPPVRLAFTWQIGPDRVPVPDPALATEVEVRFQPAGHGLTSVEITHRGWERHGDAGAAYRADFSRAWPQALECLVEEALG